MSGTLFERNEEGSREKGGIPGKWASEVDEAGRQTAVVILLIPIRIAWHILRPLLVVLLMSTLIEHLLEELELGAGACEEGGR